MALQFQTMLENNLPIRQPSGKADRLIYRLVIVTDDRFNDYFDVQLWFTFQSNRQLVIRVSFVEALHLNVALGNSQQVRLDRQTQLIYDAMTNAYTITSNKGVSLQVTAETVLLMKGLIYSYLSNFLFLQSYAYSKVRRGSTQQTQQRQSAQSRQPQQFGPNFGPNLQFPQPQYQVQQPVTQPTSTPQITTGSATGAFGETLSKETSRKPMQVNLERFLEGLVYPDEMPQILAGDLSLVDNLLQSLLTIQDPSSELDTIAASLGKLCQIGLSLVDQVVKRKNTQAKKILGEFHRKIYEYLEQNKNHPVLTTDIQPPIDICSTMTTVGKIYTALTNLLNVVKQALQYEIESANNKADNSANSLFL